MDLEENYPSKQWKHCPYCASENITWEQRPHYMECNGCKRSFYLNVASAVVAVITDHSGKILFTKRGREPHKGTLDLPGGFVDIAESAENAIVREVKEELNINVTETQFLLTMPNRYLYKGVVSFTLDIVFKCKVDGFANIKADDDVSEYSFIAKKDINLDNIGLESIKKIVSLLIATN